MTQHSFSGHYINLDRSPERRQKFEAQLTDFGLSSRYRRFPAIDGSKLNITGTPLRPGEVGVFHSHYRVLEQARSAGTCVHVLEDDALLSEHVVPVVEEAIAGNLFENYDMLFTDMMVHCHVGFLKNLKIEFDRIEMLPKQPLRLNQFQVIDLSKVFYAAFQSYIVGAKSVDKVLMLYRSEIAIGPTMPVDIFIQKQVLTGKLRAACLFPFITSLRLEDVAKSTIVGDLRAAQATVAVMTVLRYLFFLGCDLDHAKRVLDAVTTSNRKKTDARHALIVQATEFILSHDFI